jgi:cysteine desulfurase
MVDGIYFDYAATTPVHPVVLEAMHCALKESFGNPSSMHWAGKTAATLIEISRQEIAIALGCKTKEIFFTSGATEADNLALFGVLRKAHSNRPHLITSSIEHHAVLYAAHQLEREGFPVTYLPVSASGTIDPEDVSRAIRRDTALISIMMVNNETGAVQPIREIGEIAQQRGILFHTDAVQGLGLFDMDVNDLQIDLLSLSAHKIYGPKGIGALYIREGIHITPLLFGGVQEREIRPGTENVPGIAGLGAAVSLVQEHKKQEYIRLCTLRERLIAGLRDCIPVVIVNGQEAGGAPHILSVSFSGIDAEAMLLHLNRQGIAASMGSACTSKDIEPSHVLTAMGLPLDQISGTLRFSLGYPTTIDEIDQFLQVIESIYFRAKLD